VSGQKWLLFSIERHGVVQGALSLKPGVEMAGGDAVRCLPGGEKVGKGGCALCGDTVHRKHISLRNSA